MNALSKRGVPKEYVEIIRDMYTGIEAGVVTDKEGDYLTINKGIRQFDPSSSLLFMVALEKLFKKLDWDGRGISVNGTYLDHLKFADDIVGADHRENRKTPNADRGIR